ncbi:MAG: bifunctional 5,10-methylenetetrahydrofolate dehydrogenase/5,10-methenyltetrahydrofolate cyclohydrolase [Planctomycetes bacterium]|nr:bifunctional 5,10-methylenetetrahydrofolate dehydrogenase/5,10-methenyltetrahydrofolate cyclohydrolase [Planctomycetota bacterium]
MPAALLQGEPLAARILAEARAAADALRADGVAPRLVALRVGEGNAGTRGYLQAQKAACGRAGVDHAVRELPADAPEEALLGAVDALNADPAVHGILLLAPLPPGIRAGALQARILPGKDAEGVHPRNLGALVTGEQAAAPCTATAAVELLRSSGVPLAGREVVVLGHSAIVGKPVALLLLQSEREAPTVTVCHVATAEAGMTAFHTRRADVIVSAVGVRPNLVTGDMIKDGAVVIDVATIRAPELDAEGKPALDGKGKPRQRWVGDVDFEAALRKCSFVTPVPGGVGPVTSAILARNIVSCALALRGR